MNEQRAPRVAISTGVSVTSLGDPREREVWRRMHRLQMVTDYMFAHEESLLVPGNKTTRLYPRLSMRQRQVGRSGNLEGRILYEPSESYMEPPVRRVIRRLIWRRDADDRRCWRKQPVAPDVTSDAYRVSSQTFATIESATNRFEDSLTALATAVHLDHEGGDADANGGLRLAQPPIFLRWIAFSTWPASFKISFLNVTTAPEFNEAWEGLWEQLGAAIDPAQEVHARVQYPVSLKTYSRAMTRASA